MDDPALVLLLSREQVITLLHNHEQFSPEAIRLAAKREAEYRRIDEAMLGYRLRAERERINQERLRIKQMSDWRFIN